jgi:hypothetical protein
MNNAVALRDYLEKHRPDVAARLVRSFDLRGDVEMLNRLTGLNLSIGASGRPDDLCAKYLSEFRKGCPMAISTDHYLRQMQQEREDQYKQVRIENEARAMRALQAPASKPTPQPVTQPEPNPVLLLLGEDE